MSQRALNLILVGYGKMGQAIASTAADRGHAVYQTVDPANKESLPSISQANPHKADAIIDFSTAHAVRANIDHYCDIKLPLVIGTTGWDADQDTIIRTIQEAGVSCVYGSNFSLGVQLFLQIIAHATTLMRSSPQYDIAVHEEHHNQKMDSPSGTAQSIANEIIRRHPRKDKIVTTLQQRAPTADELHVSSVRVGSTPGTHRVIINSPADSIELVHQAHGRQGFALGALIAAEWIVSHPGCYTIQEMMHAMQSNK